MTVSPDATRSSPNLTMVGHNETTWGRILRWRTERACPAPVWFNRAQVIPPAVSYVPEAAEAFQPIETLPIRACALFSPEGDGKPDPVKVRALAVKVTSWKGLKRTVGEARLLAYLGLGPMPSIGELTPRQSREIDRELARWGIGSPARLAEDFGPKGRGRRGGGAEPEELKRIRLENVAHRCGLDHV